MKKFVLAAFTVLSLGATVAANAQSYSHPATPQTSHQGSYDNTSNSLGGRFIGGN